MYIRKSKGPRTIVLEDGSILSRADLPDVDTRWIARRKAIVVWAVQGGLITKADALARYELSEEEFLAWEIALDQSGTKALKAKNTRR